MTEPLADPTAILRLLTELQILALTAWAEARGDWREGTSSVEERIAVLCVIRTRARRSGRSLTAECLAPKQFSCWNAGTDANHLTLLRAAATLAQGLPPDPLLAETLYLAGGVISGVILDRVNGATHYYAPASMTPPGTVPSWARGHEPTAHVGSQVFYRL